MKLWNLSEFEELETRVLVPYSEHAAARIRRHTQPHGRPPCRFAMLLGMAALTASFSVGSVQANANVFRMTPAAVALAQSVAEPSPPLHRLFRSEFDEEWTESLEDELLMRVERSRLQGSSKTLVEQTIDTVFSNQSEDLSESARKLSRERIREMVNSRKMHK